MGCAVEAGRPMLRSVYFEGEGFSMEDSGVSSVHGLRPGALRDAYTHHARANLEQRGISSFMVEKALREGECEVVPIS